MKNKIQYILFVIIFILFIYISMFIKPIINFSAEINNIENESYKQIIKNDNGISECYDKGNNLSIFSEPHSASPERFPSPKETARFTKMYTPISLKP